MFKGAQSKHQSDLARMDGKKFGFDQIVTILCFVLLIIIAVAPVAMVVYNAVYNTKTGQIDVSMFGSVLFDAKNIRAMKNSLIVTFWATLLATVVGTFFAWLLARSAQRFFKLSEAEWDALFGDIPQRTELKDKTIPQK